MLRRNLIIALFAFLCVLPLNGLVSERKLGGADDWQNASMGFNILRQGTFARSENPTMPSMHRDPLPPLLVAIWIQLHPDLRKIDDVKKLKQAPAVVSLKKINLVYAFFVLLMVAGITYFFSASMVWSTVSMVLVTVTFLSKSTYLDRLYTEIPGAFFVVLSSLCLLFFLKKRTFLWAVIAGFGLGLVSLAKAAAFYVGIVVVLVLLGMILFDGSRKLRGTNAFQVCVLACCFLSLPLCWMARNKHYFGTMKLSGKGDNVLWARAYRTKHMTPEEYRGAFFAYSHPELRGWIARNTSFSIEDLRKGGRLQRLSRSANRKIDKQAVRAKDPSLAVSLHRKGMAERKKMESEGVSVMAEAIKIIFSNPVKHLLSTVVFSYRGMWSGGSPWFPWLAVYVNFFGLLSFLGLFCHAFLRKQWEHFGVLLFPAGFFLFYAFLTHFLSRYSAPVYPFFVISFCVVLQRSVEKLSPALRRRVKLA